MSSSTAASVHADDPQSSTITGTLRDCTPGGKGRRKLSEGDIAVVDAADISRREAQFLADRRPAAVVNIGEFATGALPNFGPLMLLDAGVVLFEGAGPELRGAFRDGARKGAVTEHGHVFNGKNKVASAEPVTREDSERLYDEGRITLIEQLEATSGNTVEFVTSEAPLFVDGLGVPELVEDFGGRKVLIVAPGVEGTDYLRRLRNFIREYEPVIIGVGTAADDVLEAGYSLDFVVGNPQGMSAPALRSGARVILPADPDGTAAGLERIQDLGVGAMTFPAAVTNETDLAILLASFNDADLIVLAGEPLLLHDVFARHPQAGPSTILTHLQASPRLIHADAIVKLYAINSGPSLGWLWALLGIIVAVATVLAVVGFGGDDTFVNNLINTWNSVALWFQNLIGVRK
ncbi:putative cytokinetic ring protein SteA [Corynebacterium uterequi]|uniref:Putative membrane-anchored protein n=1 Tax=Corynebacterium uterequi TaxID=1072256 RepID=A0A0G3HCC6_9CORY|nr:putative cytokinetic ring protein SteA [Corynebacterium uterequi]AKK11036.1 putative membrane-anchored protein [Corynebacterium uterequi]